MSILASEQYLSYVKLLYVQLLTQNLDQAIQISNTSHSHSHPICANRGSGTSDTDCGILDILQIPHLIPIFLFQHTKLPQCLTKFWGSSISRLVVLGKLLVCSVTLYASYTSLLYFFSLFPFSSPNISDVYQHIFSSLIFCFSLFHSPWCQIFFSCSCVASYFPEFIFFFSLRTSLKTHLGQQDDF